MPMPLPPAVVWPTTPNDLLVRLSGWWSLHWQLMVVVPPKERES